MTATTPGRGRSTRRNARPAPMSRDERRALGKAARTAAPLDSHASFEPSPQRDPLAMLAAQEQARVADLVPVRCGRMAVSPFTFYRGAAAVMAADLADTPASGLETQLCGDAHLSNFGAYASAERRLVFDINDFDETFPGPFEWDVKRLVASFVVAARSNGLSAKACDRLAISVTTHYREAIRAFSKRPILDVWYATFDVARAADSYLSSLDRRRRSRAHADIVSSAPDLARATTRNSLQAIGKLTTTTPQGRRIVNNPPLVVPLDHLAGIDADEARRFVGELLSGYARTLQSDRRDLLSHFRLVDVAHKVVGVGSVGLRAWILLLEGDTESEALLLQAKQAVPLVLAAYTGRTGPREQGARVVGGQRIMQTSSDIFLGWLSRDTEHGREDYYLRQLRDWKVSAEIDAMTPASLAVYGQLCAWTLARAHARSGDRVALAAYLGKSVAFDHAIAEFARAYADQNERDHVALTAAIADGRVAALGNV